MTRLTNSTGYGATIEDGAAWSAEQAVLGGGRNELSVSNNLTVVKHEANASVLSAGIGAKNIGPGGTTPIYLMSLYAHTALAGTLTITGFTAEDGTTAASLVIPVGAVGWVLQPGTSRRLENGCTMQKSSAADDGKILVDWRPIN